MKVLIKTIDNTTFPIEVSEVDTVASLKQQIEYHTVVPLDRQRLIYRGRVLEDEVALRTYSIEDDHVVHLVLRPLKERVHENGYQASQTQPSGTAPVNESRQIEPPAPPAPPVPPSFEHIRQGFLTIRTVLSSIDTVPGFAAESAAPSTPSLIQVPDKKFFVGQWLDVKDTVSQWLEATIMDINHANDMIFVHYNGW
jgi:hypothetical protein